MKHTITTILITTFVFAIVTFPAISHAKIDITKGLVTCGRAPGPDVPEAYTKECGFTDVMNLINNVIEFVLFYLAIPICAIMFFYAGLLMITAGEEAASSRTKANHIFTNAAIGLVIAFAAWLIIKTIFSIVEYDGSWIGL